MTCARFPINSSVYSSQKKQLNSVKAQIEDIQSRLDALYETIEIKQLMLEDLRPRILRDRSTLNRFIASKEELESQLNQDRIPKIDPSTLRAYIDDFLLLLEEGITIEKRAFIRGFVRQLTVNDEVATLEYTLPLAASTLSLIEEKEGVLSFEQYGGPYCTVLRTFNLAFSLVT